MDGLDDRMLLYLLPNSYKGDTNVVVIIEARSSHTGPRDVRGEGNGVEVSNC